ncbi:hypothetical protein [Streptomyces niveus]|uniref:hypothetical protein n=1 Tax=Streptomyces niveus TaxID=193462 RepID=UPI00343487F2
MLRPRVQGSSGELERAAPVPGRQHVHGVRLGEREDAGARGSTSRRRAVSWPRRRCLSRRSSSAARTDTERSWVSARAQESTSTLRRTACGTGRRAVSATARALYRRPYRRTRRRQRESGAASARDSGR